MSKKMTFQGSSSKLDPELKIIQDSGFSKAEVDELRDQLKKLENQKGGMSINKYELFDILKATGHSISERLKKHVQMELEKRQALQLKRIDFMFLLDIASSSKKFTEEENNEKEKMSQDNAEYLDAFIAMGGGPNNEGFVRKNIIIDVIKNEFELTFDMEEFLEEISATSEDLDFKAFCQLFENNNEDDSKSAVSKKSFISAFSDKMRKTSTFHVRYKDFLKFCDKMDNVNNGENSSNPLMATVHKTPFSRVHSSSPEARISISRNFNKRSNNSNLLKESISNHMIRLICKDEDIFSQSSNLTFQLTTLVPTNTPNICKPGEQFQFNICEEKSQSQPTTKPEGHKRALLAKIHAMKQNLAFEKPPNYLKSLISRPFIVETILASPQTPIPEPKSQPQIKPLFRQAEDPKKLEIKKSINKWTSHFQNQREGNSNVEFQNEIRNSLNKLTPDNYEIIRDEILQRVRNSQEKCEFLVKKIIEKAWGEQKYTKIYAQLCSFLQSSKELEFEEETAVKGKESAKLRKKNMFRSALLGNIQSSFEEDHREKNEESNRCEENSAKLKKKKKILGVVKFIGELFLIKVLPEVIIQLCATTMMLKSYKEYMTQQMNSVCESNLEGILSLYDNVGKFLENDEKAKKNFCNNTNFLNQIKNNLTSKRKNNKFENNDAIFSFEEVLNLLEFLIKNLELNKRIQILIKNLLEKRKEHWKEGVFSGEIPKKISQLHQEYKIEHDSNVKINAYNKIVITPQISFEMKSKHCSMLSCETKSTENTESGTPKSLSNCFEIDSKIKKSLLKYRTKHDSYGNDKVYESLKKLLSRTNKKKLVLSRFLQNFYNDITSNVQELLFIPYSLFEESYIEKRDFIDAFNQTFQIIWEDVRDNPKLLEFMSRIFLDFTKNKICGYEDLEHNEELMKGNEEFVEIFEEFMKTSSNLITNQKITKKIAEPLKATITKLVEKNQDF